MTPRQRKAAVKPARAALTRADAAAQMRTALFDANAFKAPNALISRDLAARVIELLAEVQS